MPCSRCSTTTSTRRHRPLPRAPSHTRVTGLGMTARIRMLLPRSTILAIAAAASGGSVWCARAVMGASSSTSFTPYLSFIGTFTCQQCTSHRSRRVRGVGGWCAGWGWDGGCLHCWGDIHTHIHRHDRRRECTSESDGLPCCCCSLTQHHSCECMRRSTGKDIHCLLATRSHLSTRCNNTGKCGGDTWQHWVNLTAAVPISLQFRTNIAHRPISAARRGPLPHLLHAADPSQTGATRLRVMSCNHTCLWRQWCEWMMGR